MKRSKPIYYLAALSFLLLLSACGSDGAPNDNPLKTSNSHNDSTDDCVITQDEQEMLDQVNQARASSRTCGGDTMPAVEKLSWNCHLREAAKQHSTDMAENNFFSHTGSDGLSVGNRVTASGYTWRNVGENIAAGQTTTTQVMTGWLNSAGHCRNIMSASSTEFGSALINNPNADYKTYWTQVLARPR